MNNQAKSSNKDVEKDIKKIKEDLKNILNTLNSFNILLQQISSRLKY